MAAPASWIILSEMIPMLRPMFGDWALAIFVVGILAAVNERTAAIDLVSPNNPTGTVFLKEDLEALARGLVRRPDRVHVRERHVHGRLIIELSVDPDDRGRVIGREGRTAPAPPRGLSGT